MSPLQVGDVAWCIVHRAEGTSGTRFLVEGAAKVRVEQVDGDSFRVVVLHGSGVGAGVRLCLPRHRLFAAKSGEEHAAFGREVARLWPSSRAAEAA